MSNSTSRLDLIMAFQVACASAAPRTASVTSSGTAGDRAQDGFEMAQAGRRRAGHLGRVVPQPHAYRFGGERLADEALGVVRREHAALQFQAALGVLRQRLAVTWPGGAQVALRVHVQADRAEHRLWKYLAQERQRHVLVLVVHAAQRRRLAAVVQQVADVVQQRGADQLAWGAGALGGMRALQRVLELSDPLAFVCLAALGLV